MKVMKALKGTIMCVSHSLCRIILPFNLRSFLSSIILFSIQGRTFVITTVDNKMSDMGSLASLKDKYLKQYLLI
jgi:hypothetical protein